MTQKVGVSEKDLEAIAGMSKAFWIDQHYSEIAVIDTIAATTLLELTPEKMLERAASALFDRAIKEGNQENKNSGHPLLFQKFYRLSIPERMSLVALHIGHWPYAKIARILKVYEADVEKLAWSARLKIANHLPYPSGPASRGPSCPEFISHAPWAQRVLDGEMSSGRAKFELERHLALCEMCREYQVRVKKIYYAVEEELSLTLGGFGSVETLLDLVQNYQIKRYPSERSFVESLRIFFRRSEIRWPFFILIGIIIVRFIIGRVF